MVAIPEEARSLNVGCGRDVRGAGWVNMDAFVDDPRVVRHDLVETPWPFPDDRFDLVYASHVLEHIPLLYRKRDGAHRDVLFEVMEEIARVLRPGGRLHLRVPYGASLGLSFANPQHYRFWMPTWFDYFDPHGKENYYTRARFVKERVEYHPFGTRWPRLLPVRGYGITVHLQERVPGMRRALATGKEMEAVLRVVK